MIKKYLKKKLGYLIKRIAQSCAQEIELRGAPTQATQTMLFMHYRNLLAESKKLPNINDVGFRVFSQTDEDGILLYLFSLIGFTNKKCVDIAFASPYGSNTANLICNHGFSGVLICGNRDEKDLSDDFFNRHPDVKLFPPTIVQAWVTAENVNKLLRDQGLAGDVDVLSLDIDGIDYWLWQKLDVISPRVVVVEFQSMWPADKSVTVPYDPAFQRLRIHPDYFGASLLAFVNLAQKKGYRLVACNKHGFNAFFIKNELLSESVLPTMTVEQGLRSAYVQTAQTSKSPIVKDYPWIDV